MRTPLERLRDSITKDNLWLYILSLLNVRDMYPYEIRKEIEKNFNFKPGNVTAYIVLRKLETDNYVRSSKKLIEKGPMRKYYKITGKGLTELKKGIMEIKKWSEIL